MGYNCPIGQVNYWEALLLLACDLPGLPIPSCVPHAAWHRLHAPSIHQKLIGSGLAHAAEIASLRLGACVAKYSSRSATSSKIGQVRPTAGMRLHCLTRAARQKHHSPTRFPNVWELLTVTTRSLSSWTDIGRSDALGAEQHLGTCAERQSVLLRLKHDCSPEVHNLLLRTRLCRSHPP